MSEGMGKLVGFLSVVGVIGFIIYQNADAVIWIVVAIVALIAVFCLYMKYDDAKHDASTRAD